MNQSLPIYGLIYLATNLVNGKKYVGQTYKTVLSRKRQHIRSKMPIGRAIRKYGMENFSWRVIDIALSVGRLDELETKYIEYHNCLAPSGYNLHTGGLSNRNIHDSTRKKLSEAGKRYQARTGQLKKVLKNVDQEKRLRKQREYFNTHRREMSDRIKETHRRFPNLCRDNGLKTGARFSGPGGMDHIRAVACLPGYVEKRKASIAIHQKNNPEFWSQLGISSGQKNIESGHIFRLNHLWQHERKGIINPKCRFCSNVDSR